MLNKSRPLSIIAAVACIYFMFADYSIYYIKYSNTIVLLFGIVTIFIYSLKFKIFNYHKIANSFLFLLGWGAVFLLSAIANESPVHPAMYIQVLFGGLLIFMKDEIRYDTFRVFVKVYSMILFISFLEYILFLIGYSYILDIVYRGENIYKPFAHTVFNLIVINAPRFQSLAEEPGVIGTVNAFLIYLMRSNEYNKLRVILYVTGFFTFSMAFYILVALFLLFEKFSLQRILTACFVAVVLFFAFPNISKQMISDRITENKVDNRTHDEFGAIFQQASSNNELFIGKGYQSFNRYMKDWDGSAGALVFIYQFGYLGVLIVFCCYTLSFFKMFSANRFTILFYAMFWLSFYQRQFIYQPFYILILYSCYAKHQLYADKVLITTRKNERT